jgi:hypothetical protein
LTSQKAHTITGALVTLGVIETLSKGNAGLNGVKAAEFRSNVLATRLDDGLILKALVLFNAWPSADQSKPKTPTTYQAVLNLSGLNTAT